MRRFRQWHSKNGLTLERVGEAFEDDRLRL